jgi:hypothetical protein
MPTAATLIACTQTGDARMPSTRPSSGFVRKCETILISDENGYLHMVGVEDAQLRPAVVIRPEHAADYLAHMDIRVDDVMTAIDAGDLAARNIDNHHPVTAAGLSRWIQVVGRLRAQLAMSNNWYGENPKNRPVSYHTKKSYTLSTVGGTDATGVIDHPTGPKAANKKGTATAEAVTGTLALIAVDALLPDLGSL